MLPNDQREKKTWPSPLMDLVHEIIARRGEKICILATGDPMQYGIGVTFAKRIPIEEMVIFPALSAFSLAVARLGWDLSNTQVITLHGRPLEMLIPHLSPGARILALSDNGKTPAHVAALLTQQGYGKSNVTVLEHMGGKDERKSEFLASDFTEQEIQDLNTIAIECPAHPNIIPLTTMPGLPDDAFVHDGQLTKQEIRSTTLSALSPFPGQTLWDVGAGCGSIGIEWMRCSPQNKAIAIESRKDRLDYIQQNRHRLGTPHLQIIEGSAPEKLDGLPAPDAIFIGGGLSGRKVFDTCWEALQTDGRLVANAVTVEGEQILFKLHQEHGGS